MRLLLIISILMSNGAVAIAQKKSPKVEYLDRDWMTTRDLSMAVYYRTVEKVSGKYLVKDYYYANDSLQMEAFCSSVNPKIVQDGDATFYHRNGRIERTGLYQKNIPTGLHKRYYESGNRKSEMIYDEKKTKIIQYWKENGEPLLVNGTGLVVEKEKGATYAQHIEVIDSIQISIYAIEQNQDTIYLHTQTPAAYRGGFEAFYRKVGSTLVYPKEARKKGIEGRVYVQFAIDKKGAVDNAIVLRGIGGGCDEVAVEACMRHNDWEPAYYKGRPVKMRMVLPITFRLR